MFHEKPLGGRRETERRESNLLNEAIAIYTLKKFRTKTAQIKAFLEGATLVADSGRNNSPQRQRRDLEIDPTLSASIVNDSPSAQLCGRYKHTAGAWV